MGEIPSMSDSPFEAEAEGTGDVMYFAYGSNMDPEQIVAFHLILRIRPQRFQYVARALNLRMSS